MVVYIGYLLLVFIESFFFFKKNADGTKQFRKKEYLIVCCAELILLAGLRAYTVGADTVRYLEALEYYSQLPRKQILAAELVQPFTFEAGYFIFTKICAFLHLPDTVFLFVVACIIYIPLFRTIFCYSKSPTVSIFVYFGMGLFAYSLGIFRQMIAISIILCGIKFIEQKKFLKYILIVAAATLFHTTALITLPLYFLPKIKSSLMIKIIIPAQLISLLFGRQIILLMTNLFPRYATYIGGTYDVSGGSYLMLIFLNGIYFVAIFMQKRLPSNINPMALNALALALVTQSLGYSMGLFGRIVPYFTIFLTIVIPDIISCFKDRYRKGVEWMVLAGFLAFTVYFTYGNIYITPYRLFWQ